MCGILGMLAPYNIAQDLYTGLYGLQHRGKESAGIVTYDGINCWHHADMGEIAMVFRGDILKNMPGPVGIAHNRYSTTGESEPRNIQPIRDLWHGQEFWVAHNGNIVNSDDLRKWCQGRGAILETTSDTGVMAKIISLTGASSFEEAVITAFPRFRGAFSMVILYMGRIIALRDTFGFRPLSLGQKDGAYFVASETGVFSHLRAKLLREVEPGEVILLGPMGPITLKKFSSPEKKFCIFEYIYFLRPDAKVFGRRARTVRERMGELLFLEHPAQGDFVLGIPDSGEDAGRGFANISRIPNGRKVILRTHLTSRTFIEPIQELRERGVELKFVFFEENILGKNIIIIDDSLVRGTTLKKFIARLRDAGAARIDVRISSPPYRFPCHYGIDTDKIASELSAARYQGNIEEIKKWIGADSLGYLSIENATKAIIEIPGETLGPSDFCTACFTGNYPIPG
ncbi:MAG: amidophosphoribosyltransferase [Candidatus Nealsonbacteria bacterium]|nr:amidophosphoribosyltransferase [Candidatus Nealsonbacteria bacterium]